MLGLFFILNVFCAITSHFPAKSPKILESLALKMQGDCKVVGEG